MLIGAGFFLLNAIKSELRRKARRQSRSKIRAETGRESGPSRPSPHSPPAPLPSTAQSAREPTRKPGEIISGRCWVVDGDTIVIDKTNIRLFGIDAPEMEHPYGRNAKYALMRLCKGKTIRAEVTGGDHYDRVVARCRLEDGTDLSALMVETGHAIDWPKFSGGVYRHLEEDGIRKRLWRCDARQKGRFIPQS